MLNSSCNIIEKLQAATQVENLSFIVMVKPKENETIFSSFQLNSCVGYYIGKLGEKAAYYSNNRCFRLASMHLIQL